MKPVPFPLPSLQNEPLSHYTTFGIGGPASYLIPVETIDDLAKLFTFIFENHIPYLVIGKGSNVLFNDRGFEGVVILNKIHEYERQGHTITVGAGYSFSLLGKRTVNENFSGLEFAVGIPATVGGAIYMNAGIGVEQTCTPLIEVTYVTEEGEVRVFQKKDLEFGYRTSSFQKMRGAIGRATFQLTESPHAKKHMRELIERRLLTQPYKEKSAGCVFRNPPQGPSAGALIDQCGLKGEKIGGAEVSTLHANFIINRGGATAQDVLKLSELIRSKVKEKTGIELKRELCDFTSLSR